MEHTIITIVHAAIYSRHSVADEMTISIASVERGYHEAASRPARTEAQGKMYARIVERNAERLAELQALRARFASFRGELASELPPVHDKSALTEPALTAMARATEDEVFRAAVRTLGGNSHG